MIRKIKESSGAARGGARWLLCVCLAAAASSGFSAVAQDQPRLERPLFEASVFSDGDILIAPVQLQGKTYRFLIDTGAALNVYDPSLRASLGPAIARVRFDNTTENEVEVVHPAKVSIGRLAVDADAHVIDLEPIRNIAGYDFHGILGMAFLGQHIVAIDFDRGTFSLLRSVPDDAGEMVKIHFSNGLPFLANIVPGFEEEWFLLDTGVSGLESGFLRYDLVASLLAEGIVTRTGTFGASGGLFGVSPTITMSIRRATVGPFEHRSLLFDSDRERNVLGLGMLRRYRIILDFPNGTAYFKPSKYFNAADTNPGVYGISLRRVDGAVQVASVRQGKPASRAGIRPGDKILSIGAHDCQTVRLHRVQMLFCEAGKTVPIVVQRGEQRLALQVKLASREAKALQADMRLDSDRLAESNDGDLDDVEDARTPAEERTDGRSDAQAFTNTLGMKFKRISAGEFLMGDEESLAELKEGFGALPEGFDNSVEHPRHKVRITRAFYMGVYEVTKEQFAQFVTAESYRTDAEKDGEGGYGYDRNTGDLYVQKPHVNWRNWRVNQNTRLPVVNVSWNDATTFCQWMGKKEGKRYRLPTEAEWEYACRAGTATRFSNGDAVEGLPRVGNVPDLCLALVWGTAVDAAFIDDFASKGGLLKVRDGYALTAPVGCFRPNAFGLYDMHGNAAEWCSDYYDNDYYAKSPVDNPQGPAAGSFRVTGGEGTYSAAGADASSFRVIRGGAWSYYPLYCRSASRYAARRAYRANYLGFRVVCEQ